MHLRLSFLFQLYADKLLTMSNDSISTTSPRLKQLGIGHFCSPLQQRNSQNSSIFSTSPVMNTKPKRKYAERSKTSKDVPAKYKLDGWLCKKQPKKNENCQPPISSAKTNNLTKSKSESSKNKSNQKANTRVKKSKNDDELCSRYNNIRLPSIKDIVQYEESLRKEKECLEYFDSLHCSQKSIEFSDIDTEEDVVLDCKHLELSKLTICYQSNFKYISDIFHGKRYNERHETFLKMEKVNEAFTERELRYNVSMISFTFEQKEHLLDMLHEDFVETTMGGNSQYFCKVLLPELCLKIFMDTHHMNNEEAVEYLENH